MKSVSASKIAALLNVCLMTVLVCFSGGSDGFNRPVWAQHPRVHHAVRRSA